MQYFNALSYINRKAGNDSVVSHSYDLQFLPEGGDWINNLPSVVAFKAIDSTGKPIEVFGTIVSMGEVVSEFSTSHDGMGSISLVPRLNKAYNAIWKDPDGIEHNTILPARKMQGVALHISDLAEGKKFFIFRSHEVSAAEKELLLVAYQNNEIIYEAKVNLSVSESIAGMIPTKGLSTGILYLTLFNKNLQPLAERVTFVNNHNYNVNAGFTITDIDHTKHGLNKIKLYITDTLRSNFSVAITDADLDNSPKPQDNIISHLFLTGDLKGKIQNPGYYFVSKSDSVTKNMDLVMLTHGCRKYHVPDSTFKESNYITLSGELSGANYLTNLENPVVNIIMKTDDKNTFLLPINIDKLGRFVKDGIVFYGSAKLYFKFNNKNIDSKRIKLKVNNGFLDSLPTIPIKTDLLLYAGKEVTKAPDQYVQNYFSRGHSQNLKEVSITAKKTDEIQKLENTYTAGLLSGGISTNLLVGADPKALNYISLFDYLKSKITGMQISNYRSLFPIVLWRDRVIKFYLNNNESSAADIRSLGMAELDYIKVYDPSMGGAFGTIGGVIAVYTKKGKGFDFSSNELVTTLSGYNSVKEFYSPNYGKTSLNRADVRKTLYWQPNIIMDKGRPTYQLEFYNNDIASKFKIIIEGINSEGKIFHSEKIF
ncbi:MAG: hypothetical protein JWP71_2562 [Mucilaginibacter sp.]|nr:hypothetical protein [Mucilaginibacter sp.]